MKFLIIHFSIISYILWNYVENLYEAAERIKIHIISLSYIKLLFGLLRPGANKGGKSLSVSRVIRKVLIGSKGRGSSSTGARAGDRRAYLSTACKGSVEARPRPSKDLKALLRPRPFQRDFANGSGYGWVRLSLPSRAIHRSVPPLREAYAPKYVRAYFNRPLYNILKALAIAEKRNRLLYPLMV